MAITTLRDLCITGIRYTLDFERRIVAGMPRVAAMASGPELVGAIRKLQDMAADFAGTLETMRETLGEDAGAAENAIAQAMLRAVATMAEMSPSGPVRDAAIVVELNQQQLYRVATYGAMLGYARQLGEARAVAVLKPVLARCRAADATLSDIAVDTINPAALAA